MLAVIAGHGHWPLIPTNARVYPSGAAFTHPKLQLYVLVIAFGFDVAVGFALVVAVVLIVEHAVNAEVLESVDVTSVVTLEDVAVTLTEELDETEGGPVF
jgi:hypothetical protein